MMKFMWISSLRRCFSNRAVLNTFSCVALMSIGDIVRQQWIEKRFLTGRRHCWTDTANMAAMGLINGPFAHCWYSFLDRLLPLRCTSHVLRKVLMDQILAAPVFTTIFLVGMSLLEGQSLAAGLQELRSKFVQLYLYDWYIWPPAQLINFKFVPPRFRVIFVYSVDVLWFTVNSIVKH